MITAYPACFFKEENGYSVIFPDLNDLATCGETLEEANAMAVDCLAGYLFVLDRDGEAAPPPSKVSAIHSEEEAAFIRLVRVDVAEYAKAHFEKAHKTTTREMLKNRNFESMGWV